MVSRGKWGRQRINWETGIDIYTTIYKRDNREGLTISTRSFTQYFVTIYMGKESKRVGVCTIYSLCCILELTQH